MLLLCIILRCIPRQTQSDISANIVSNISCESGLCYNNHIIVIYNYYHIISISVCYLNLNKVFVLKNTVGHRLREFDLIAYAMPTRVCSFVARYQSKI